MTAAGPLEVASWYEEETDHLGGPEGYQGDPLTDYLGGPQHWDDEEPDVYEEPPRSIDEAAQEEDYDA